MDRTSLRNGNRETKRMDLAELYPGFESVMLPGDGVDIFCRIGGDGPPLVLQHGYPQTHVEWHAMVPELAKHFTLVLPDLRGYGQSEIPETVADHTTYSKRTMANDIAAIMTARGHERFSFAGHDRGGRVGYRLALDHPERVEKLVALDIIPTYDMWTNLSAKRAMQVYHWLFKAQPHPLPEMLIEGAPGGYLDYTIASWTKTKDLSAFDDRAMDHYHAFFADPKRIHATCEDYRAGRSCDLEIDRASIETGAKIVCPTLVLWGTGGIPAEGVNPLEAWEKWAFDVSGQAINSGHFLPEENPAATLAAMLPFLKGSGNGKN